MSNKTILILGANSDIGFALASKYFTEGYSLILAGRSTKVLEERIVQAKMFERVTVTTFDALNFSEHHHWFNSLLVAPDIVCCVFGYLGDQVKAQHSWDEARTIIETNYTGAVSILNVVAEFYNRKGNGTIIGISSVAGERGRQSNYIYGSAKAGFTAYLAGLRNALFKYGVHVLTVKPGFVATKMTAGLRLPKILTAHPADVAKAIFKAVDKKRNCIYTPSIWFWIMIVIRSIPEFIFKRLKM